MIPLSPRTKTLPQKRLCPAPATASSPTANKKAKHVGFKPTAAPVKAGGGIFAKRKPTSTSTSASRLPVAFSSSSGGRLRRNEDKEYEQDSEESEWEEVDPDTLTGAETSMEVDTSVEVDGEVTEESEEKKEKRKKQEAAHDAAIEGMRKTLPELPSTKKYVLRTEMAGKWDAKGMKRSWTR